MKHQETEGKETPTDIDSDHKGILKQVDSSEDTKTKSQDLKGAFKKESSVERSKSSEPRGILKKESSFEMKISEPEKSALKKSSSKNSALLGELKGILKKESSEEEGDVNEEVQSMVMEIEEDKSNQEMAKEGGTDDESLSVDDQVIRRRGRDKNQTDR